MRGLLAVCAVFILASPSAHAQVGALYRCPAGEYTNLLSAGEAQARQCTKIADAEWVVAASDSSGNKYAYNDRRTVFRGNGLIETWLQVVRSALPGVDAVEARRAAEVRTVSPLVIECSRRKVASGPTYVLDLRDSTVVKDASDGSGLFPPPGAISEVLLHQLCTDRRAR
jgi:hypothetical protein